MATISIIKERIAILNQANFQILCDDYLSREGYRNIVALGTMAESEKTTKGTPDTYFCNNEGKYIFVEYSTQKENLVTKIKKDIEKCLNPEYTNIPICDIDEIIYCHNSSNINPGDDLLLKELCQKSNVKLNIIGIDKLAEDLCNKYRFLAKKHLNMSIDTGQIQSYDDFLKQHDDNTVSAPLKTIFGFREDELSKISDAFSYCNIVLLHGPAGVGKTRLALEYAEKRVSKSSELFYCIHSRSLSLFEDITMYFEKPGDYFIFVDDANQLSQFNLIVELVNKQSSRYNVQIIATVREYNLQKVKESIADIAKYVSLHVTPLSDDQIKTIVKNNYKITNGMYLSRIARIAGGNCRIAILASKIACETDRLDSINDVTELYSEYYGKIMRETNLNVDVKMLKTAGVMAYINSFSFHKIDSLISVLNVAGLNKDEFVEYIYKLNDNEVVDIYDNHTVVFSEQCFSNFILKFVFIDKKLISLSQMTKTCFEIIQSRTEDAVKTLISYFHSDNNKSFISSEIHATWTQFKDENSHLLKDFVKTFYMFIQTDTLIYIKEIIDSIESVYIESNSIDITENYNKSIDDDILIILGGFAYLDNFESALDLYFNYFLKRPDKFKSFFNAFLSFYSVTRYSFYYDFKIQLLYLRKIKEYSNKWENKYICLLFLQISKELLKIFYTPFEITENKKSLQISQLSIPPKDKVFEYRKLIWIGLEELSQKTEYYNEITNILCSYGNGINDVNTDVIKFDLDYSCQLLNNCPEDDLHVFLAVNHLQDVYSCAGINTNQLDVFINNSKFRLYNLLVGFNKSKLPRFDNQYYSERERIIRNYLFESNKPIEAFSQLFCLFCECFSTTGCNTYDAIEGINLALQVLSQTDYYIVAIKQVLNSEYGGRLDCNKIIKTLFQIINVSAVYLLISCSHALTANIWEYAYFSELPVEYISDEELQKLYSFLKKENDKYLTNIPFRNILFVSKFSIIDKDVLFKASRIVLSKQSYLPHIVNIYFEYLFIESVNPPSDVINMFSNNFPLLESIYTCLDSRDNHFDYNGRYLFEICSKDKNYISQFVSTLVEKNKNYELNDISRKCSVFYNSADYLEIIDFIVMEASMQTSNSTFVVPGIIKQFVISPITDKKKIETWIEHFIIKYNNDIDLVKCMFHALVNNRKDQLAKYMDIFIRHNKDYEAFKQLPLVPNSPFVGSFISALNSWISILESYIPLFRGILFIKHKKRVEDLIESYRDEIKNEETKNLL